jgi:hypothetical protein
MKGVMKIASYLAAVVYLASYYLGYAREAEIILLLFGIVLIPYGTYKLLHTRTTVEGIVTPKEAVLLNLLKRKMYLAIGLFEFLLLVGLIYRLTDYEPLGYLFGAAFMILSVNIYGLWNAKCPRCQKRFFRTKKRTATFTVGPESTGVHYYPVQVDITPQCVECGLSWRT